MQLKLGLGFSSSLSPCCYPGLAVQVLHPLLRLLTPKIDLLLEPPPSNLTLKRYANTPYTSPPPIYLLSNKRANDNATSLSSSSHIIDPNSLLYFVQVWALTPVCIVSFSYFGLLIFALARLLATLTRTPKYNSPCIYMGHSILTPHYRSYFTPHLVFFRHTK